MPNTYIKDITNKRIKDIINIIDRINYINSNDILYKDSIIKSYLKYFPRLLEGIDNVDQIPYILSKKLPNRNFHWNWNDNSKNVINDISDIRNTLLEFVSDDYERVINHNYSVFELRNVIYKNLSINSPIENKIEYINDLSSIVYRNNDHSPKIMSINSIYDLISYELNNSNEILCKLKNIIVNNSNIQKLDFIRRAISLLLYFEESYGMNNLIDNLESLKFDDMDNLIDIVSNLLVEIKMYP